jgi:hypothetical protein
MSASPLVSPVADVRDSFGAAFIGLLVSTTLFGVTIAQTWVYFWNYRKDSIALKFFVAFVTAMDAVHTILSSYAVYWYLILNYGNVEILNTSMWALNVRDLGLPSSLAVLRPRSVDVDSAHFHCMLYF